MSFHKIVLIVSLSTLYFVLGDENEDYENDIKQVAVYDQLSDLQNLSTFITGTKSYSDQITEINKSYGTVNVDETDKVKYNYEMDKVRLNYEMHYMKRNLFFEYFQCSQASFAFQYLKVIHQKLKADVGEDRSQLYFLTQLINSTIQRIMAALYQMKYIPPKWMVMLSIFSKDLNVRSAIGYYSNTKYKKSAKDYMLDDCTKITKTVTEFLKVCDKQLKVETRGSYSKYNNNSDEILEYATLKKSLEDLVKAFESSVDVLNHKGYEYFHVSSWLVTYALNRANKTLFLELAGENPGIYWNNVDETYRNKMDAFFADVKEGEKERNAVFEAYENGLLTDVQNFLKDVYRVSVIRFIHVGVTKCDTMYWQLNKAKWDPKKRDELFVSKCKPVVEVAGDAIKYLGKDEFIESLQPLLDEYIKVPNQGISKIRLRSFSQLNYLGTYMGVDNLIAVKPLYEEEAVLNDETTDTKTLFKWVTQHFEEANKYTVDVENVYPKLNFKTIEYIQKAVTNEWIQIA